MEPERNYVQYKRRSSERVSRMWPHSQLGGVRTRQAFVVAVSDQAAGSF